MDLKAKSRFMFWLAFIENKDQEETREISRNDFLLPFWVLFLCCLSEVSSADRKLLSPLPPTVTVTCNTAHLLQDTQQLSLHNSYFRNSVRVQKSLDLPAPQPPTLRLCLLTSLFLSACMRPPTVYCEDRPSDLHSHRYNGDAFTGSVSANC